MTEFTKFKQELLLNPKVLKEYEARQIEFAIAKALIKARLDAQMTQTEVAGRMKTSQSQVARMESGHHIPSFSSVQKYAKAVNRIIHVPINP